MDKMIALICLVALTALSTVVSGSDNAEFQNPGRILPATLHLENRDIRIERSGIDSELAEAVISTGNLSVRGIVLLASKPSRKDRATLEGSGITLLQFLKGSAYLADFKRQAERVQYPPFVIWAGKIQAKDKMEKALLEKRYESWAVSGNGVIRILLTFRKEVSDECRNGILKRFSERFSRHGSTVTWRAEVAVNDLLELAAHEAVVRIEQGPHPMMPLKNF